LQHLPFLLKTTTTYSWYLLDVAPVFGATAHEPFTNGI